MVHSSVVGQALNCTKEQNATTSPASPAANLATAVSPGVIANHLADLAAQLTLVVVKNQAQANQVLEASIARSATCKGFGVYNAPAFGLYP